MAAIDELTAAEAIELIDLDLEPLPFVVDPVDSLKPGSPNARLTGNVWSAARSRQCTGNAAPATGAGVEVDRH